MSTQDQDKNLHSHVISEVISLHAFILLSGFQVHWGINGHWTEGRYFALHLYS